ncbi:MAG: phosphoribosylaminoimidazolesuccinocarboxamide synthase [Methanomicrobiales archaeon]|nr:phosphoribosylaminoimidazolesuccinocarboxamide synthase [Methanomicrobiales archaeon]
MPELEVQPTGLLYEGKAKSVYTTADQNELLVVYRDDMTAFNGGKHDIIANKGHLNARACKLFMTMLEEAGVATHFIRMVSETSMLVRKLHMIPLEIIVRNIAAGSLIVRYPFVEGQPLEPPTVTFDYKSDERGDPMIIPEFILALGIATAEELTLMRKTALQINTILKAFFDQSGIMLVDFKLEFGRSNGAIYLGDEISMDSMRLWDKETHESFDKDVYRLGKGDVIHAYTTLLDRILPLERRSS